VEKTGTYLEKVYKNKENFIQFILLYKVQLHIIEFIFNASTLKSCNYGGNNG
jgi:hypothetical protein